MTWYELHAFDLDAVLLLLRLLDRGLRTLHMLRMVVVVMVVLMDDGQSCRPHGLLVMARG